MTTTIKKAWNFYINTTNGFIPLGYQLKDFNRHLETVDLVDNNDTLEGTKSNGERLTDDDDDDDDDDTGNDELLFDAQESIIKTPRRRPVEKIWTTIIENRRNEDEDEIISNDTMEEILPGVYIKRGDSFSGDETTLVSGNIEQGGDSNASNILDDLKFNDAVSLVNIVIKLLNEKENKINSKEDLNSFKKIYFKSIIGLINSINLEPTKCELIKQILDNFEIKNDLLFKRDDINPMINKNYQYDDEDNDEDGDETRSELYAKIRHNLVKFERVDYAEFYNEPIDRINDDVCDFTYPDSEDSMYGDGDNEFINFGATNDNSRQSSRYPFTKSYDDPFEDDFIVNKEKFKSNGEIMLDENNDFGNAINFLNKYDDILPNEKLYKIIKFMFLLNIDLLIKTIKVSIKLIEFFKPIFQIIFIEMIKLNEKYQILNSLFNFFISFILQIIMFLKEGIEDEEGISNLIFNKLSQLNKEVGGNTEFFESKGMGIINENEYPKKKKLRYVKPKSRDYRGGKKRKTKSRSSYTPHGISRKENMVSNEEKNDLFFFDEGLSDMYDYKSKKQHDTYNVYSSMYNRNKDLTNNNNNDTYSKKLFNLTMRKAGEYLLQSQFNDIKTDNKGNNSGYYY
ncbi:hypothetical protein B5S32_g401 [[Candida] boidinii]|nr:hypothetical protein B5S32_g401 [[Candida] boidinii]